MKGGGCAVPSLNIESIDEFVQDLITGPILSGPEKRFVEELGMDIDLRFALDQAQPALAITAIRLCAVRAFGGLDKITKKMHKSLKAIGAV